MLKRFWLSYDLGIDGDYDTLYAWLDEQKAMECGDSMATFQLDVGRVEPPSAVKKAITKAGVRTRPKDRLYLIWRNEEQLVKGEFIAGKRRRAPWAGYAVESDQESDDVAAD